MSNICRRPILYKTLSKMDFKNNTLYFEGKCGTSSFFIPKEVSLSINEADKTFFLESQNKAILGTTYRKLSNTIKGLTEKYEKKIEIAGIGYRVSLAGKELTFLLGFSGSHTVVGNNKIMPTRHPEYGNLRPVKVKVPDHIDCKLESETKINLSAIDKEKLGQFVSQITKLKELNPYKLYGIKEVGKWYLQKVRRIK